METATMPAGWYRPPAQYIRVDGEVGTQFEGLWAEIRSNLIGAEVKAIESAVYFADLHRSMAPHIRAWNYLIPVEYADFAPAVLAEDGETVVVPERTVTAVAYEPLAPPADAGFEVLSQVDQMTKVWLRAHLLAAPYRVLDAKPTDPEQTTPEEQTPEGNSSGRANEAPSGTPETTPVTPKSRRSRASSTKP